MEEQAVIDRIEGGQAVLLIGQQEQERLVPAGRLPAGARPGDWLRVRFVGNELADAVIDREETDRVRQRIADKLARLRERGRRSGS